MIAARRAPAPNASASCVGHTAARGAAQPMAPSAPAACYVSPWGHNQGDLLVIDIADGAGHTEHVPYRLMRSS